MDYFSPPWFWLQSFHLLNLCNPALGAIVKATVVIVVAVGPAEVTVKRRFKKWLISGYVGVFKSFRFLFCADVDFDFAASCFGLECAEARVVAAVPQIISRLHGLAFNL